MSTKGLFKEREEYGKLLNNFSIRKRKHMHVLNFGEILKGKKVVDRHQHDSSTTFQVGDRVWLLQGSIKTTRPCCKLDYQHFGPYVISGKINDVTFRLDLPPHMHLHPIFHVSLLESYTTSSIPMS